MGAARVEARDSDLAGARLQALHVGQDVTFGEEGDLRRIRRVQVAVQGVEHDEGGALAMEQRFKS